MIKASRILVAATIIAALPASARQININSQPLHVALPAGAHITPAMNARIDAQLQAFVHNARKAATQNKTTATETLMAQTDYDYTATPGQEFQDSLRLVYSGSNGSAYDFFNLTYDYDNYANDVPNGNVMGYGQNYILFDSVYGYAQQGSSTSTLLLYRKYNASGKVTEKGNVQNVERTYFTYDANGRVKVMTYLSDNGSGGLDSNYRDIYLYNGAGQMVKDSSENWDGMAWQPGYNSVYAYNAGGLPTQFGLQIDFGGLTLTVLQYTMTYNSANRPQLGVLKELVALGAPLRNSSKDSFGYAASTTLIYRDNYNWDTTALVWTFNSVERRHLNVSSLPDSVWAKNLNSSTLLYDTTVTKYSYNANGNPTAQTYYDSKGVTPEYGSRYYYDLTQPAGIGQVAVHDITVYPNPARDEIKVGNAPNGTFAILNAAGQMMVSGTLSARNNSIGTQGMPAGNYMLILMSEDGMRHSAQFVKQ